MHRFGFIFDLSCDLFSWFPGYCLLVYLVPDTIYVYWVPDTVYEELKRYIHSWDDVFFLQREFCFSSGRQLGTLESMITQSYFGAQDSRKRGSAPRGPVCFGFSPCNTGLSLLGSTDILGLINSSFSSTPARNPSGVSSTLLPSYNS